MKKSLLALAVLGAFAGVASAQSSVTIYGTIDQGLVKGNGGSIAGAGATATGAGVLGGNGTSKAWQLRESRGSRLGFRGNEDLGGGLSAQFVIEHRFSPDTGVSNPAPTTTTPNQPFWNGSSWVQLTHAAAGSVYLGRTYTPGFYVLSNVDAFTYDGIGQAGTTVNYANFAGNTNRAANMVGYRTPSWGGFQVNLTTALSEGAANTGRRDGVSGQYSAGPIYAALAYERISGNAPSGTSSGGNRLVDLSFSYDFGVVKPYFFYASSKTNTNSVDSNKSWVLGLSSPIGPGKLKVALSSYDPQGNDNTQAKFALGYDYFLSKRTKIYADLASAGQDNAPTAVDNKVRREVALGVRHDF